MSATRARRRTAGTPAGDPELDRLAAAVDVAGLIRLGWDPQTQVLRPDPAHPLLGYTVCACGNEADRSEGMCAACAKHGRDSPDGNAEIEGSRHQRWTGACLVCRAPGASRPAAVHGLCLSCNRLRSARHQSVEQFVAGDSTFPPAEPRPGFGSCAVVSCDRVAAHGNGLCHPHDHAWRRSDEPDLEAFCATALPARGDRWGGIVFRGLPERVILELLLGVQSSIAEGRQVQPKDLRTVVDGLRRLGVANVPAAGRVRFGGSPRRFLNFTVDRVGLVLSDIESEYAKDVWDLRVWGRRGRLSFIGGQPLRHGSRHTVRPVRQAWLRESAKAWACDALISTGPHQVRGVIAAVGLWSEHLARRADRGEDRTTLGRSDLDGFLARLNHLERAGSLSKAQQGRIVTRLARFLRECRELGLTQPGRVLAGVGDDVVLRRRDQVAPVRDEADEAGRALPEAVLAQLLSPESLDTLEGMAGPAVRTAFELQAGVGRRTAELCRLALDCLDYDSHTTADGQVRRTPVLVHDMPKVNKIGCRLPIHDREAVIIGEQQERVRVAFPHTPAAQLALFPRVNKNPEGTKPFGVGFLQRAIRTWVDGLPQLDSPERDAHGRPVPFPRLRVSCYALRHSFAQRHADAGTPVDALKDLMGHDNLHTTQGYYRVTAKRKREAQDRLGPLQLDAAARLVRPGLVSLGQVEALRDQIGQVAVPFGICTEPTNVDAGGRSCPFRHRCFGCEHFRTDPSYQPELTAYLTRLLEDRERLAAAVPQLAEWARRDAVPSEEEIEAVRRLISANTKALAELSDDDRAAVEEAIATIRKDRANLAVSFPVELRGLVRQSGPTLFPAIERSGRSETSA